MYNVFKRPMFKLGGQADQGSGIMSHVEPRQNYMFGNVAQPLTPFQDTYTELPAYAYGGRIGYQKAGPVNPVLPGTLPTVKSAYPTYGREQLIESMYGKDAIQNAYQKEVDKYKENIKNLQNRSGMLSQDPESGVFIPNIEADISRIESGLATLQTPEGKKAFEAKKIAELNKTRKQEGLASLVPSEEPKVEGDGSKKITFDETKKTDPREDIKAEAEMLKGLLRNEGLTTAENALIIAKALGTPGGINAKIAAAGDLALPIIRDRAKLDKEATLEAYKTSKEIQKSKIAAGAMSATEKLIERDVQNTMRMAKVKQKNPDGTITYDGLTEEQIRAQTNAPFIGKMSGRDVIAGKEAIDRLKKQADGLRLSIKPEDIAKVKTLDNKIEELKRDFRIYSTGGRINMAIGGMSMDENTVDEATGERTETIIDTNVDGFPMKPVQKLSFEEIRNRLPKEITDDIVRLISNSAEALQDFSYIKTQQDVSKFNVKYGVNLVLPQNA
jgi:energy-coupling factor transporter ATP-binding protein EcfA2